MSGHDCGQGDDYWQGDPGDLHTCRVCGTVWRAESAGPLDIRWVRDTSDTPIFAGAAASLADGESRISGLRHSVKPSVREDKQRETVDPQPEPTSRAHLITSRDEALKQAHRARREVEVLRAALDHSYRECRATAEALVQSHEKRDELAGEVASLTEKLCDADETIERQREEITERDHRIQELEGDE